MIVYKLTDQNMCTLNKTQWEIGIPKHTSGKGELCSRGWLHSYSNKYLAILLNPIHARIKNPKIFKAEATGNHKFDRGLKQGSTTLKLLKEIPIPKISTTQKIAFAILCSLQIYKEKNYIKWANKWLKNNNRSKHAAYAAAYAAYVTANAAAYAAYAAANAANAAAYAAAYAANAAAYAAANAANAAAYAAANAANADVNVNLKQIVNHTMKYDIIFPPYK